MFVYTVNGRFPSICSCVFTVRTYVGRIEQLTCGGMANYVRDAFAETMTSVVQLAARYPIACCNSIGLLCIIPYTRYLVSRLCQPNATTVRVYMCAYLHVQMMWVYIHVHVRPK